MPITLKLTAGQAHDGRCADDMPGAVGSGRSLLADAAYDSNQLRDRLERFFSKLKHYRAIAARYEKRDANFLAIIKLPATRIRSRVYEPVA